ncbi:MAG: alpha/beta fold hydrolase [Deltaproteobacteria bacterium]|nr:alpha/beta fold hydrolase [Deltaproteobacteria bacterium]
MKAGFRLASSLAPPLAALAAEELFMRPPRPKQRPAAILEKGHRFTIQLGNDELKVWSWGDGPTVLLQHGWGGRSDHLAPFVEPLLASGFSVVAPDAPAHGDSQGTRSSLVMFTQTIEAVAEKVHGLHGVIAHSMGAAATAMALSRGLDLRRVVFIASPASLTERIHQFSNEVGLAPWVGQALRDRLERRVGIDMDAFEMARVARTMATSLLVFHDPDDREIPWRDGATIAQAWPGAKLIDVPGAGHHRILRDPQVISSAIDFMSSGLRTNGGTDL